MPVSKNHSPGDYRFSESIHPQEKQTHTLNSAFLPESHFELSRSVSRSHFVEGRMKSESTHPKKEQTPVLDSTLSSKAQSETREFYGDTSNFAAGEACSGIAKVDFIHVGLFSFIGIIDSHK